MERTLQNLAKAFTGESQARNRYNFYAKVAKKEGYEQIAEIFTITAENERVHAKRLFEHIQELKKDTTPIAIESETPTVYETTEENLQAAIEGEKHEYAQMYPEFAKIAEEENLPKIAARFRAIAKAEEHHEARYKKILEELKAERVFQKNTEKVWICRECGYTFEGKEAPAKCPSCDHPQSYYQILSEEY